MVFAFPKYGFCVPKVWFLRSKSMVFAFQKYGFYISYSWFCTLKQPIFCSSKNLIRTKLNLAWHLIVLSSVT
ncbi:hypothetical protein HMPREF9144_2299 [Prevotella pallens ATCC 700821]|uniref:Uncharacterized protein n=1 Tax=Prevotella pallens ATCC 700821 TaxID=997353 RepID=F9DKV7_9BACT|nr:hypothetical protein HMPREF9144_2299 [Prevotella pallens ATCC 700821]